MEIKNVLVVLAGALVLSLIVSLAVVGNFKGTGYAVGDTVKTPVIYEGAVREFVIGQFAHRIVVRDVDSSGAVYFELDGSEKYRIIKGETIQLVGRILVPSQSNDFDVTLLYTGKNIFGKEYAVFQVTEVATQLVSGELVPTTEEFCIVRDADECTTSYPVCINKMVEIEFKSGELVSKVVSCAVSEKNLDIGTMNINVSSKDVFVTCCKRDI